MPHVVNYCYKSGCLKHAPVRAQHVEDHLPGLLWGVCLGHDLGHVWHSDPGALPQSGECCTGRALSVLFILQLLLPVLSDICHEVARAHTRAYTCQLSRMGWARSSR